jgi:hypothetical protein
MNECPVCGAIAVYNETQLQHVLVSRVVNDGDEYKSVKDSSRPLDIQYTRVCKYAKRPGCLNPCKTINSDHLFENLNKGVTTEQWLPTAREITGRAD